MSCARRIAHGEDASGPIGEHGPRATTDGPCATPRLVAPGLDLLHSGAVSSLKQAETRYTVAAATVAGLLAYAEQLGIDSASIVRELELDAATLRDPEARITHQLNHRAWERVAEISGDPDFGLHMAERMNLDAFHVLGHLAAHSATVGTAFARIVAYSRLLHDAGRVEVERDGDEVVVYPGCRGLLHAWPRQIAEFSAASVLTLTRLITGVARRATRVGFKHPRPASLTEHARIFGVNPRFGVDETFVSFPAAMLDSPVIGAQAGLSTFLDAYARELVAKLPVSDKAELQDTVRRLIADALPKGVPTIAEVAAQLATTPRTLQRRLGERGSSFQTLLDEARRDFAERYVLDGTLALAEIAFLLGFADPSNFHRAFRRWTGTTPMAFRAAGVPRPSSVAEGH